MAASPAMSAGSVVVSLNNPGSTTLHEITVEPGDTFTVDINVEYHAYVGWVCAAATASSVGVFDVVEVTDNPPWTSQGTFSSMVGPLDPTSGVSAFSRRGSPWSGVITMASIQIAVDAEAAIGTYGLNTAHILWTGSPVIPERWPGMAGPTFSVHVVPEPSLAAVLILSGLLVFRRGH
jgi:hypothetical protein